MSAFHDESAGATAAGPGRITLTRRGRSFVTVGAVALLAGLIFGVRDLERVGVLLLALPAPAWFMVSRVRTGLIITHTATPPRADVGDRVEVRLSLANPRGIGTGPVRVTEAVAGGRPLRFSVAGVRARQRRTVSYPLPPLSRGRYTLGPTTILAGDPFGLVVVENVSVSTTELVVRPKAEPLSTAQLPLAWRDGAAAFSHSIGSGGSDDASVREYRHGDDLRKIHWKTTARSGSMMVRQEERPWQGETLIILDTRAAAFPSSGGGVDSAPFESAVTLAASIGVHLAERRRPVVAVTGSGAVARTHSGDILDLLADARPRPEASLSVLSGAITSLGRDATILAVLSGFDPGAISAALARHRVRGNCVAFLLDPFSWTDMPIKAHDDSSPQDCPPRDRSYQDRSHQDRSQHDRSGNTRTGNTHTGDGLRGAWTEAAEALRSAGWRVVGMHAGERPAEVWTLALQVRR